MANGVSAPCPTDSTRVRIPEGISWEDKFKSEWDGFSMTVKCPEGKGAGDEMDVVVPTAAHRNRIKELALEALGNLPKPVIEKKRKLEDGLGPSAAPPPSLPPPAAPHLAAPMPPDQGAGAASAVPSTLQLGPDDGMSDAPPLLQLLAARRASVEAELAAGKILTAGELEILLCNLVKELEPLVRQGLAADQNTLEAGLASLGWNVFDNTPFPEASPPTPQAVLAFLVESLAKLGPASAGHNPCSAPALAPNASRREGAPPAGGAALGPLYPAGSAPMALQPVAVPEFERPQLKRGTLGAPVRLATNFTTLNIRGGQEVFKCEVACWNPMYQRLQPHLYQSCNHMY